LRTPSPDPQPGIRKLAFALFPFVVTDDIIDFDYRLA
jgi:hypothetical protein